VVYSREDTVCLTLRIRTVCWHNCLLEALQFDAFCPHLKSLEFIILVVIELGGVMLNRVTVNGQVAARSAASTFHDDVQPSTWKIGLMNEHGKYLTAETFGFTINAAGTSLRRKQLWTVERDPVDDETVYFRSHLGRYLAGDRKVR